MRYISDYHSDCVNGILAGVSNNDRSDILTNAFERCLTHRHFYYFTLNDCINAQRVCLQPARDPYAVGDRGLAELDGHRSSLARCQWLN